METTFLLVTRKRIRTPEWVQVTRPEWGAVSWTNTRVFRVANPVLQARSQPERGFSFHSTEVTPMIPPPPKHPPPPPPRPEGGPSGVSLVEEGQAEEVGLLLGTHNHRPLKSPRPKS